MPRRAAPGDRVAIERLLTVEELGTLADVCRLLSVPRSRWPSIPVWEQAFTTLAGLRLAENLRLGQGLGFDESLDRADVMERQVRVQGRHLGSKLADPCFSLTVSQ